jgi:LemA protein
VAAAVVVLVAFVMIAGLMFVGAKNRMVRMNEGVDAQWAQVENQLKRRNDLIPNLVSTVKGYAAHEKGIFTDIAEARSKLAGANTVQDKITANNQLSGALSRLLLIVERYPNLKADKQFSGLMYELSGTENRIAVERMRYNDLVRQLNTYIKGFPGMFFAGIFKYEPKPYFEVPEAEKAIPKVDFGTK